MAYQLWHTSIKPWNGSELGNRFHFQPSTMPSPGSELPTASVGHRPCVAALPSPMVLPPHSLESSAAGVRVLQFKVQLGFILDTQRHIKDPSPGLVWGSTAENDSGGSKPGMGEVQHLGLCVLNFLGILVWAEHSLEGLDNSCSTGGGRGRSAGHRGVQPGCSWSSGGFPRGCCATLTDRSRLKLPPWHVLPGRERAWLGGRRGKISVISQGEFDS